MVEGDGFEPSKQEATDLQSAPFGHSGTPPYRNSDIITYLFRFVNSFFRISLKILSAVVKHMLHLHPKK